MKILFRNGKWIDREILFQVLTADEHLSGYLSAVMQTSRMYSVAKLLSFPVPVYFYFRFLSNRNFDFSNSNMWRDFKFKLKVSFGILWKIMVALLTIKWLIRVEKVNWSSNHLICILFGMLICTSTSAMSSFPFIVSTCSK